MTLKNYLSVGVHPYLHITVYLNTDITKEGINCPPLCDFPVDYTATMDTCNLNLLHYLADDCKAKIRFVSAFHSKMCERTRIDLTVTITDPHMLLDMNLDSFYHVSVRGVIVCYK